ncbi:MAG TPA: hypothetical protein VFD82_13170 [Planctomycetota bacterium]|nr:hypothetical protein [Planctomycetota bacterium]
MHPALRFVLWPSLWASMLFGVSAAQAEPQRRWDDGGDLDKIVWNRPFARAQELARESGRVLLIKPILGGGNVPKPGGVPCGGKNDCEGSW